MPRRRATSLLVFSTVILMITGLAWTLGGQGDTRADLEGAAVTAPFTTSSPGDATTTTSTAAVSSTSTSIPTTTTTASPATSRPTTSATATPRTSGGTQKLRIPALGVDANVVPVGLERDGSMEIPGASEAGWYWPGPRPGSIFGSAVIAAHVDYNGKRGVFFDLRKLAAGSNVTVTDERGDVHTYVVTERFQVNKDELPIDELFRGGGAHVLTLITCGGAFDSGVGHYDDNIVVRAVPA